MKYKVGLCKRYWKYVEIEADSRLEARIKASEEADVDNYGLPYAVQNYADYNNKIEVSDVIEA